METSPTDPTYSVLHNLVEEELEVRDKELSASQAQIQLLNEEDYLDDDDHDEIDAHHHHHKHSSKAQTLESFDFTDCESIMWRKVSLIVVPLKNRTFIDNFSIKFVGIFKEKEDFGLLLE